MKSTAKSPGSYTRTEARDAFLEDTGHIIANFRFLLELPLLTSDEKQAVKDIVGEIFAVRRGYDSSSSIR